MKTKAKKLIDWIQDKPKFPTAERRDVVEALYILSEGYFLYSIPVDDALLIWNMIESLSDNKLPKDFKL